MGRNRRPQPLYLHSKLLKIRMSMNLTQEQMAKNLSSRKAPVHPGNISEYETSKREPSLLTLLKYARLAGVAMDNLVDDELDLPEKLPGNPKHKIVKRKPNS
jgi:transcriptional regulator with XRE-family HTH domain